jgi:hypothetical protein
LSRVYRALPSSSEFHCAGADGAEVDTGFFAAVAGDGFLAGVVAGIGCFSAEFVTTAGCCAAVFVTGAGVRCVAAVFVAAGEIRWVEAAFVTPGVVAAGTGVPAICGVTVLPTGDAVEPALTAAFAGTHGAAPAVFVVAGAAAFLRPNIDPRLEIADVALVIAALAFAFCWPAEFATFASFPPVVPGGQGWVEDAGEPDWPGTKLEPMEEAVAKPPDAPEEAGAMPAEPA